MLIVNVKESGSIERALKLLKRKFEKTKTLKELRDRREFKKPSEVRRAQVTRAKYSQSFKNED